MNGNMLAIRLQSYYFIRRKSRDLMPFLYSTVCQKEFMFLIISGIFDEV